MAKRKGKSSGRRRSSVGRAARRGFGAVRRGFALIPPGGIQQALAAGVGGFASYVLPAKLFGKMAWFTNPANKWAGPASQAAIAGGLYLATKKFAPKFANAVFLGAASVPVGQIIIDQWNKSQASGVKGLGGDPAMLPEGVGAYAGQFDESDAGVGDLDDDGVGSLAGTSFNYGPDSAYGS